MKITKTSTWFSGDLKSFIEEWQRKASCDVDIQKQIIPNSLLSE